MGRQDSSGLIFDSGALIAFEASDRRVDVLVQRARDLERSIVVPAAVVAQVWRRGGSRQARLAILLNSATVTVEELTRTRAQLAGQLCGRTGTSDVVDASVVVAAWSHGHVVVTSDPNDILRLDPRLKVIRL